VSFELAVSSGKSALSSPCAPGASLQQADQLRDLVAQSLLQTERYAVAPSVMFTESRGRKALVLN
jgi:hypothetical protein